MIDQSHRHAAELALFSGALEALHQGRPADVIERVQRGCADNPRSARLWHIAALLLRDLDRRREALIAFNRALSLAPDQPRILIGLAHTLFEAGQPSVDAFAAALARNVGNAELVIGLSHALMVEGRRDEAIAGHDALLGRTPAWVEGHELLARIRWSAGERAGFARSFDRALAALPAHVELRRAQLITLAHAGFFDEVLAAVDAGRKAIGDNSLFDVHQAIVHAERGEFGAAQALFANMADLDDQSVQVRRMRLLLSSGRACEAAAIYDQYAAKRPPPALVPYASLAWRMLADPRWQWLEGDPRFVGVYELADQLPPLDQLAEVLRSLHRAKCPQLEQSVRGGTQTEGDLLTNIDPLIEQCVAVIRLAIQKYIDQLPPVDPTHPLLAAPRDRPIRFAGSWSVRLTSGGHHANHIHPMGWLSSALYVVVPETSGHDQRAGWLTLGQPQNELRLDLKPSHWIEPKPGRLVLFPSTMWHGTIPTPAEAAGERLTIAFDVATPA